MQRRQWMCRSPERLWCTAKGLLSMVYRSLICIYCGMPAFCTWTDFALHARQSLLYYYIRGAKSPDGLWKIPVEKSPFTFRLIFCPQFFFHQGNRKLERDTGLSYCFSQKRKLPLCDIVTDFLTNYKMFATFILDRSAKFFEWDRCINFLRIFFNLWWC